MAQAVLAADTTHPMVALMARETSVRRGAVPRSLGKIEPGEMQTTLQGDEFLFNAEQGIWFYYRRGEAVTLDCKADADPRDIDLWLNGTVYAAVATMNGLFPLHASAVAHQGRVHAFTGPGGAGKSTLVAALGRSGFAHFCDDTLLLDISGDGPPLCLPGHKRLKLWPEGVALAGVEPGELVADDYRKHFVEPMGGTIDEPLPLAGLYYLDQGEPPQVAPLAGGDQIERLQDDHYTAELWRQAADQTRAARFATLAALARRIAMRRFGRPFDPAQFPQGIAFIAAHIAGATA